LSKQIDSPKDKQPQQLSARMAGEERRLQILRVAMRLFAHSGFRGTTTKKIAQAAGVSEAMVFRHFATKDELYDAILDQKACDGGMGDPRVFLDDAIKRRDDRAVFETLALRMMLHHEQDTEFLRLLTHSALEGHQFSEMFWERVVTDLYEFLGGYVRERQRDGAFRNIDPVVIVRAFAGMVIHHSLNNTLWDKKRRLLDITDEQAARAFTSILLSGISEKAEARAARGRRAHHSARRVSSRNK